MIVDPLVIASDSSDVGLPILPHVGLVMDSSYKSVSRGRSHTHQRLAEPRARSVSLPRMQHINEVDDNITLPTTTYDETAVSDATLNWLGALPKPRYQVSRDRTSDRNRILGSYFHRATPSI
jgi:hypothetical protein